MDFFATTVTPRAREFVQQIREKMQRYEKRGLAIQYPLESCGELVDLHEWAIV